MKYFLGFLLILSHSLFAQKDFSNQWQDLYSYNDVKDFTIVGNKLYAISENAMFIYDLDTQDINKFSSVNGLSGNTTSSVSYDHISDNVIIGYENGLVEIISNTDDITPLTGVKDNLILVDKEVKGFYRNGNFAFIYGDFGIVEVNIDALEFGDSYRLSNDGIPSKVNKVIVDNQILYAATEGGLYSFDLSENNSSSPINFNNWNQVISGNVQELMMVANEVVFSLGNKIYSTNNTSTAIISESNSIQSLSIYNNTIVVTTASLVNIYDNINYQKIDDVNLSASTSHSFTTEKAIVNNNYIYFESNAYGVLFTALTDKNTYQEIHPEGPTRNDAFTITVKNNQKWIVYGGFATDGYNGLGKRIGVDYFKESTWNSLAYNQIGSSQDCTKIILDPFDDSIALGGSYSKGVLEFNNYEYKTRWNQVNTSGLLPGHNETNNTSVDWVSDLIVDNNNMVWVGNSRAKNNKIFTMYDGTKSGVDRWIQNVQFPELAYNGGVIKGLNKMFVDANNNIFAGTTFNGVLVFNADPVEKEKDRKFGVINALRGKGELPSGEVLSVVSDENNKIWIGTDLGLVVFDDYQNLFNETKRAANKVIIEENGIAREFLGETQVNEILIDQANNKWFATSGAGVIYTSSDAQTTFNIFNSSNSPLPSDNVIDLELDKDTGLIYMVTDKGVVVYDNKSEPFGTSITSIVAYPNPAIRNRIGHEEITIVAKDGNGIPDGTNVKILDVSGRLVFETNVSDNGQSQGGKVVWNKKNLRGTSVASGIYIVLLSNSDGTENTTTKIAIVN
ncbi:type IX secretion system anionic LPS delivery protein PorZ [Wenyingzhuangia aestuarii]|uniref:type IX secretion system anionic LPS delivery protein PorZ n=1 Tax=Wenyingzhuangia aestuarii TaxID=1647582 RepID=UPI001438A966|nr:hypothetical protein [Wenyingzhuangia aestuarii]NJB82177.1 hypothetical protein [Wenyingzhuangia aestuarii]